MNLYQIRYFLAVAETASFTKAAARVAVTQPTLSAGIAKLEAELGAPLFERGARGARLSPAGTRFLEPARAIIGQCQAALATVRGEPRRERLRLGALRTIAAGRLAGLLGAFAVVHPGVDLVLLDGSVGELERWLGRGRIDVALTALATRYGARDALALARERYLVALAERHPLARRGRLRLEELHEQNFIVRSDCEVLRAARRLLAAQGVRPRIVHRSANDDRVMALVAAGLGAALAPESHARAGVAMLPVTGLELSRRLGLRWRPGRDSETLDRFRSFAASHDWIAERPGEDQLGWAH